MRLIPPTTVSASSTVLVHAALVQHVRGGEAGRSGPDDHDLAVVGHRRSLPRTRSYGPLPADRVRQGSGVPDETLTSPTYATRSDRCCSELSRWSGPNGGNWRCSRTSGGTADQSYVSVTVVRDGPVASRS